VTSANIPDRPSENTWPLNWIERRGVAEMLVGAIAFLAYGATLGFQFVYDDKPQIVENPAVHAWHYLPHYFTSHVWAELYPKVRGNYYRPLFLLWFRLNHALFGLNPAGWHLTTVICHVIATYLVFALVRRLTADRLVAFFAATLFGLHPVHIESVAWVSGVTDPLLAIFMLASFLAYLRFREENRLRWAGLALLMFALDLFVKETAIVLAPIVFVYAWLYAPERTLASRFVSAVKQSAAFFAIAVLCLGLRVHVLKGFSHPGTTLAWSTIVLTGPSVLWMYVRHLVLPVGLSGFYGLPYVDKPTVTGFTVPMALMAVVIVALAWGISRLDDVRLALFACCWMVLPILPVLYLRAFVEGDIAHDRYLYIPSIGFVLLVVLGFRQIANRWRPNHKPLQLAGIAVLAIAYTIGTATQQTYWASDMLLYSRGVEIAPNDNLACNNLANALLDNGHPAEAIALYSQVLAREPSYWLSNYNLGYSYYKIGYLQAAELYLRRAIGISDVDSDQYVYLGLTLWRQGQLDEAAQYVQRAIQIRPSAPGYHFVLGVIRQDQKNLAAAESEFALELKYQPESNAARQRLTAIRTAGAGHPDKRK